MKRTLLFILVFLPMLASAQTASDVQNSGCLKETRGVESQGVPTIVLTKESSILSVQLLNYESNCCTEDFNVTSTIRKDSDYEYDTSESDGPLWVLISVDPVGKDCNCVCPFNVSFTVRDLESNSFYLNCWWYRGYMELTEGEPYVMAIIDDIYYHLLPSINEAEVIQVLNYPSNYTGNVEIPEKVVCNGTEYRVTRIQKSAFSGCRELTSVTIPNSITKIEETTFANCLGLTSVNIPNSVTSIGEHAFYNCKELTSVSIPNNVTEIQNSAFRDCSSLTSITIPNSVAIIEEGAFAGCSNLRSIVVEEGNTVYDSRERCNAIIKTSDNELIVGCMNTTIPNSVTTISSLAFFNCIKLTSITIPNGVTKIGSYAFQECSELTSVTIPGSVSEIGENAFIRCRKLRSLTIHDGVIVIGNGAFAGCRSLNSFIIPNSVTTIGEGAFNACESLTSIAIPNKVTSIGSYSFEGCKSLTSATIPNSVTKIGYRAFDHCSSLTDVICYAENVPTTTNDAFNDSGIAKATLHVPAASVSAYQAVEPWKNFKEIVALPDQSDYRPFVEDGKVWKLGNTDSYPVQQVSYYYFDGDTIIDGKTCKQMMCREYVSPEYPNYDYLSQQPSLYYVGAWYEEDKKVYEYDTTDKQFRLMYDFSLEANGIFEINYPPYVFLYRIGPRQTGGIEGFKGVYRDVWEWEDGKIYKCAPWLEGVGIVYGSPTTNVLNVELADPRWFLISCTVGEEVIYLIDGVEDEATPEGARKRRFDFTHTIKIQPKSRTRSEAEQPLYGEYNDQRLGINLDPLDDTYQVRITDETGKAVYEKSINAGNIVGLNIDISAYAEGRYTVTVENSYESFRGEFEAQTTGIEEVHRETITDNRYYNLQGQRLSSLRKGLNIVNGQKVFVK